ncbi:helix-turn-helix domain-containing protein [Cohnella sp. 56]|uniref:helix-turn-helix domain-containing protein n=1 Tax=Cohnella sp. 56 TaxID=3113722 RepID=UPI0030E9F320
MNVLIVDDEMYAVLGMKDAIDWEGLGVTAVYEAYNMKGAVRHFEEQTIHIMICDIEMPKGTGLDLLEWVNGHSPDTETIFLTAHGDFHFMQRAIQLSSFDYMMKPVEFPALEATIKRAMQTVEERRSERARNESYKPYYDLWNRKKMLLSERFWYDLLAQRVVIGASSATATAAEYGVQLREGDRLLPILVSVENWMRELSTRDEEVMEYAVRQSALEMLVADARGEVVQTKHGVTVALLFLSPDEVAALTPGRLSGACQEYIAACRQYLNCQLSCYIGEPAALHELAAMYRALLAMEYNNLSEANQLNWLAEQSHEPAAASPPLPDFAVWSQLLELGKADELIRELRASLRALGADRRFGADALQAYHQGFQQMIHYHLQKKGLSASQLLQGDDGLAQGVSPPRTLEQMEKYGSEWIGAIHRSLFQNESVVQRLRAYIADHLGENVTREMLAEYVHLNPAYLSRLFKKETGLSITDYLLGERMRMAKELISRSALPISEIARTLGYNNFSYFSRMFRKVYHANPQQFRKQAGGADSGV